MIQHETDTEFDEAVMNLLAAYVVITLPLLATLVAGVAFGLRWLVRRVR